MHGGTLKIFPKLPTMGLDTVELVLRIDETFSIDLPDDECTQIITVGDLYRAVLTKLNLTYIPADEIASRGRDHALAHLPQLIPWTTPDVWATLRGLITDQLQIDPDEVTEPARFQADLRCE